MNFWVLTTKVPILLLIAFGENILQITLAAFSERFSEEITPKELEIKEQTEHKYVAIHIDRPFDNPFVTIPGAYHTLNDYMRTNGLVHVENEVIPCFETEGTSMDVYIACKRSFICSNKRML